MLTGSADNSESLGKPCLFQDFIGGVPRLCRDRNGEVSLRDRAVPNLVAAFAGPDQPAAGIGQEPDELSAQFRHWSADQAEVFFGPESQREIAGGLALEFKKFRKNQPNFLDHGWPAGCLDHKAGHLATGGDPDAGFAIPPRVDVQCPSHC